jgi:hypothetical protein
MELEPKRGGFRNLFVFCISGTAGGTMSSINLSKLETPLLIVLGVWGFVSAFQGAALSMFVSGPHQDTVTFFIEIVYFGVLAGLLVSLLSARLASLLLIVAAITALVILYQTDGFGHGLSTAKPFLWAIAFRPVLVALLLLVLPLRGPLWREFVARRAKNISAPS